MLLALKILSYAGWVAATLVGFFGSWVWNFTQTDPANPASKILTVPGKWAIGVFIFSIGTSIVASILTEVMESNRRAAAQREKQVTTGRLELLKGQNDDLNSRLTQVLRRHGIWDLAAADRTLHGKLTHLQSKIRGRAEERERLQTLTGTAIPFDKLAILATFNLNARSLKRNPYWTEELAGIISFMEADVVFLQEVPDQEALRSFRKLLPQYDTRWLKLGNLRYKTGLAILYRRATVQLIDEPEVIGDPETFARSPLTQRIKIGDFECQVVNLHLVYGGPNRGLRKRRDELEFLLKEVRKRYSKQTPNLILAGVFQWDEKRPEMKAVTDAGMYLVSNELPDTADETPMSERVHRFSNFALSEAARPRYIERSVRYEDLRAIYPNFSRKDWQGFVDHNPLLIALRTD